MRRFGDVTISIGSDFVAVVEVHRPPANFFDVCLIESLSDAYEALDDDEDCRAIILCSEGRHFCAGADFTAASDAAPVDLDDAGSLYREALRLFKTRKPVVAAIQGSAVGGGLGLACSADFRVGSPTTRLAANFARLGIHHGFGLSVTLPKIIGQQAALEMLYTGRRVAGGEAHVLGLVDRIAEDVEVRGAAHGFAANLAISAPLALQSIRQTMRSSLMDELAPAMAREASEQVRLKGSSDFLEGIAASAERRTFPSTKSVAGPEPARIWCCGTNPGCLVLPVPGCLIRRAIRAADRPRGWLRPQDPRSFRDECGLKNSRMSFASSENCSAAGRCPPPRTQSIS